MAHEYLKEKIAGLEEDLKQSHAHEKVLGDLLEKKLNEIYVHYHIARTIGSLLDLHEMLEQVFGIIRKSLPIERISVYLFDERREKLELAYESGFAQHQPTSITLGQGTPGRVVEYGEHIHIHDLSLFYSTFNDFIHYVGEEKRDGSYIGITLKVHNMTIGVIGMDNSSKYGLSVDDMDFMAILSHQLAAGIEKSLLFDKLERIAQHDGLTGLYNHRMFQEKLRHEISRRGRTLKPLSLMMLDIDHFKQYNDNFGHQAGDAVLRELSNIISDQSRCHTIDTCCRYGGEEFAIIFPGKTTKDVVDHLEELRAQIEASSFRLRGRDRRQEARGPDRRNVRARTQTGHAIRQLVRVAAPTEISVTASMGVATSSQENVSAEEVVKAADKALYRAKAAGRNRIETGSTPRRRARSKAASIA